MDGEDQRGAPSQRGREDGGSRRPRSIDLHGLRQNNLRGIDLHIPHGALVAITGVSGSGKSSLAFDTLYAEGQRRYAECLSSYARQFLARMQRPAADRIEGILPTVALEQGRRLDAARSSVGSLTDAALYLRLLFAHAATPDCPRCGAQVARARPEQVAAELRRRGAGGRVVLTFALDLRTIAAAEAAAPALLAAGYSRVLDQGRTMPLADLAPGRWVGRSVDVVQDRVAIPPAAAAADASDSADDEALLRLQEAVAAAMTRGGGAVDVHAEAPLADAAGPALLRLRAGAAAAASGTWSYRASAALVCDACATEVADPPADLFSAASALGACPTCSGFGRVLAIDLDKVIPDPTRSLRQGAIKPWSTDGTVWERAQLEAFCQHRGVALDQPWSELAPADRRAVLEGQGPEAGAERFYGVHAWFAWQETRAYKMHVRVLLSRYRSSQPCPACGGSRLQAAALAWRMGGRDLAAWQAAPIAAVGDWLDALELEPRLATALQRPRWELRRRLGLLVELGLGYLTLNRPGRTLSGGELQRVQIVAALATGLSQVLYVLDEPSVGLHPRDNARLLGVLRRLQAGGNTVVFVEHDPALIAAADLVVELGPGAGSEGGALVHVGDVASLRANPASPTGAWLSGRRAMDTVPTLAPLATDARSISRRARDLTRERTQHAAASPWLTIHGARAHNLRGDAVRLLRGALNVVCGVSGAGKSTLVEEVLARTLLRARGHAVDEPGACDGIDGAEDIAAVVWLPAGAGAGSIRSNPATLLKVWDRLRARLAADPEAKARGLDAAAFSFNRPGGRCEACEGLGFEQVDMQFLSDVRLRCEACDGRRFGSAVLEVYLRGLHAADLLEATAADVAALFADDEQIAGPLRAMTELGLGYLRLGQPLATLSGGEAQRMEIVRHLLLARTRDALLLLDEPTTGLHLDDVRTLLATLRRLVAAGNTVVVIEHHLGVLAAADHLVELGPEGGPGGGAVLFQGSPWALGLRGGTPTAPFLARIDGERPATEALAATDAAETPSPRPDHDDADPGVIAIRGARVHNLRGVDLDLPRDRLVVVTGVSGSGKSSLAFDVVFAEGQRRFLDTTSPYARQFLPPVARPEVESLRGLPPTVAIAQRTTRGGARSTVGTLTEIWTSLRLLFARLGTLPTARDAAMARLDVEDVLAAARERLPLAPLWVLAPVIRQRKGHHREVFERLGASPGAWVHVDGALIPVAALPTLRRHVAHDIDAVVARLVPEPGQGWNEAALRAAVLQAAAQGDGDVRLRTAEGPPLTFALAGAAAARASGLDPMLFSFTSQRGWCPSCRGSGQDERPEALAAGGGSGTEDATSGGAATPRAVGRGRRGGGGRARRDDGRDGASEEQAEHEALLRAGDDEQRRALAACPVCGGARLRPEALAVRLHGATIDALGRMTPAALQQALRALPWPAWQAPVAGPLLAEIDGRVARLLELGLDYLPIDRAAMTLSGGESQRIRLAAQLQSNLAGVLYVLDEPTIGLHPRDNRRLLAAFAGLVARGNGVVVVEHDEDTIRAADIVVELGPGGGDGGGRLLHAGPLGDLLARGDTPTARALRAALDGHPLRPARSPAADARPFGVRHARRHTLRDVELALAPGLLHAVCGVSGSGKSTLVRDLLVGLARRGERDGKTLPATIAGPDGEGFGLDAFARVVEVDQAPIGRTPRSCPATYLGVFDEIRGAFAALPDARAAGLRAPAFSFNVRGGRCEVCAGAGVQGVGLSFLPTAWVACEACGGSRYAATTLQPRHRGASIADVLGMAIDEAAAHFAADRRIAEPLRLAQRVGLGYLRLGQGSNTLSGGEAQRLKLVAELAGTRRGATLYVLDEPSTGLHLADQAKLAAVLQELVDRGDTVILIEHNLDLLRAADHVVELGPGAGEAGGRVIFAGPPAGLAQAATPTGAALRGEA